MNGSMTRLVKEHETCSSLQELWAFSRKHFYPCQKSFEIQAFLAWAATWQPRVIVEIGVAMGGTTYLLANGIPSAQQVIGVDFFPRHRRALSRLSRHPGRVSDPAYSARAEWPAAVEVRGGLMSESRREFISATLFVGQQVAGFMTIASN